MSNMTRMITLLAALAVAGPALAQDTGTATETETPTDAAPQTDAAPATDETARDAAPAPTDGAQAPADAEAIDMGEPVAGAEGQEPQPGQAYIREVFDDWALRCIRAPEGPDPCQLYQLLLDADGNSVAEVSLVPLEPGNEAVAGAMVVVPLETQLTAGLAISIDGSEPRRYPYDFCNRAGCVARFGMNQEQVDQLRRGAAGRVSIVPALAPDQRVDLNLSLTGFTAGYTATNDLAQDSSADAAPAE